MKAELLKPDLADLIIAACRRADFELDPEKDDVTWKMVQAYVQARTTARQRSALRSIVEEPQPLTNS
jgi:hypothetical protein